MGKKEEVTARFRIESDQWNAFVELCKDNDTTASREIRRFIKKKLKI